MSLTRERLIHRDDDDGRHDRAWCGDRCRDAASRCFWKARGGPVEAISNSSTSRELARERGEANAVRFERIDVVERRRDEYAGGFSDSLGANVPYRQMLDVLRRALEHRRAGVGMVHVLHLAQEDVDHLRRCSFARSASVSPTSDCFVEVGGALADLGGVRLRVVEISSRSGA